MKQKDKQEIKVLKFESIKIQKEENCDFSTLDDSLIPYWHLIEGVFSGEYTSCGMAIPEYRTKTKKGKITCPYCLEKLKFYRSVEKALKMKEEDLK